MDNIFWPEIFGIKMSTIELHVRFKLWFDMNMLPSSCTRRPRKGNINIFKNFFFFLRKSEICFKKDVACRRLE